MSGDRVGVIRLGTTLLVVTTPLPPGSVRGLALDSDVDVMSGTDHFVLNDLGTDPMDREGFEEREREVVRHVWYELHNRGVVGDSEPPLVVEGDPRRMLSDA